ncbi:MAG: 2'-5' RNA ligase family protein [Lachnospiraceae bacterium]|nr:2'-5' RNA ligase family protein [Lachnospiraceae bacterium]
MLCVIAKLDQKATDQLNEIKRTAYPAGADIKTIYGHITLAAYIGDDELRFVRFCKRALADVSAFYIRYHKIEVLDETSIIVAAPEMSEPLTFLHQCIAEEYEDDLDRWTKREGWYPHTTLIYGPQLDLHSICRQMTDSFSPFEAGVNRIEFSRVCENGYEIIDGLALLGPCV